MTDRAQSHGLPPLQPVDRAASTGSGWTRSLRAWRSRSRRSPSPSCRSSVPPAPCWSAWASSRRCRPPGADRRTADAGRLLGEEMVGDERHRRPPPLSAVSLAARPGALARPRPLGSRRPAASCCPACWCCCSSPCDLPDGAVPARLVVAVCSCSAAAAGLVDPACRCWARALAERGSSATRGRGAPRARRRGDPSRTETLDHTAAEVRRIERDLHDGAQARIAASA